MQQLIFVHIPKTAGVAVSSALKDNKILLDKAAKNGARKYGFVHKYVRDLIRDEDKDYPTVAVVRNPFDRIYSVFQFYQKLRNDISKDLTFEQFVMSFKQKFLNKKPQFTDCFEYVCGADKQSVVVTNILRFETLEQDFCDLINKYQFSATLQKLNENNEKKVNVDSTTLFSEKMKEEVENIFSRDFKAFGYTYEQFLKTKIK